MKVKHSTEVVWYEPAPNCLPDVCPRCGGDVAESFNYQRLSEHEKYQLRDDWYCVTCRWLFKWPCDGEHQWTDVYTDRDSPQSYVLGQYRGFKVVGRRCVKCGLIGPSERESEV